MVYQKHLPCAALRPYINWFYILEIDASVDQPVEFRTAANPCCALVFNYGERYRLTNDHYQRELLPDCFLSGVSTQPYQLHFTGKIKSLGVIFRTATFWDVFQLGRPGELLNRRLDASCFMGKEHQYFREMLAEAPSHKARFELANDYFLKLFIHQPFHPVDRAMDIILDQRGLLSMDQLTHSLFMSPRHFRRLFSERTGVSPKLFARIKRFGYTYFCLNTGKHSWQDFLGENGFYDQSHLIRDFKLFSGSSPKEFLLRPQHSLRTNHAWR